MFNAEQIFKRASDGDYKVTPHCSQKNFISSNCFRLRNYLGIEHFFHIITSLLRIAADG